MTALISVAEFLTKRHFVVPSYQRGYKWSLLQSDGKHTHLERLLDDLTVAHREPSLDYHLQGVTVKVEGEENELIDGQQRTTSLYLLLLYAHVHGEPGLDSLLMREDGSARLDYRVRTELKEWLRTKLQQGQTVNPEGTDPDGGRIQDIVAFDRAWRQVEQAVKSVSMTSFITFVLKRVKLIYVVLDEGLTPTEVFSMMNNEKAVMTKTDLVKAKLLSDASRLNAGGSQEADEREWQINQRRSHYAREWDRWRQWWENKEHHAFFGKVILCPKGEPHLGRLLRFYLRRTTGKDTTAEALYSDLEARIQEHPYKARGVFEEIRDMQEILQEWYEHPKTYNALGLLFYGTNTSERELTLIELFNKPLVTKQHFAREAMDMARWSLIQTERQESAHDAACNVLEGLTQTNVYEGSFKEDAFRQLLRMNVDLLPENERFPFEEYQAAERSLEHIQPKSKVIRRRSDGSAYEWAEDGVESGLVEAEVQRRIAQGYLVLSAETTISEHSIGNLVLLSKGDNSAVGTNELRRKREILFDRLRHGCLLLHTLKVLTKTFPRDGHLPTVEEQANRLFDDERWNEGDIIGCRQDFACNFRKCYGLGMSETGV